MAVNITFTCDGCDMGIPASSADKPPGEMRAVSIEIHINNGATETHNVHLCGDCLKSLRRKMTPKSWERVRPAKCAERVA